MEGWNLAGDELFAQFQVLWDIVGVGEGVESLAQHIRLVALQDLAQGGVRCQTTPFQINHNHANRRVFERVIEARAKHSLELNRIDEGETRAAVMTLDILDVNHRPRQVGGVARSVRVRHRSS
jgi:hypothetical protein